MTINFNGTTEGTLPAQSSTKSFWRRLTNIFQPRTVLGDVIRERSFLSGAGMLLFLALATFLAPVLIDADPFAQNLKGRLLPPGWSAEGTWEHPLGTDALGRDYFMRLLLGAQTSVKVSGFAVLLSASFGTVVGLYAGFKGKHLDTILMRLADIQLAFPFIILCISLLSVMRPTLITVSLVLAVADWVIYSRLARSRTLLEKEQEYTLAAQAMGATHSRIIFRHILPNVLPVIIVVAALEFGTLVQVEAILSFLGLGIQPPTPSWGNMLGEGRNYLATHFYLIMLPGLFLFYAVLGINMLSDGLRNVLDPASRQ
ncbi:MAG: ABC transporter permease [Anaerolineales bacterium]|nr:ABC transporter permease [Anaerolineales bacterium]